MFNTRIIFWVIAFASVVGAVILITPFLPAILWATVFSILVYPWYLKLRKKNCPANIAALTVTLAPLLLIITPLAVFGTFGGIQLYEYVTNWVATTQANGESKDFLVTAATQLNTMIEPVLTQMGVKNFDLVQILQENKEQLAKNISGPLTKGLSAFVITIVTLVISVLTTFFMVRDSHHLLAPVSDIIPLPKDQTKDILNRMSRTVRSVFFAVFIVAILQGFLCGMAFLVAGVEAWLVLMLAATIAAMIPLLGAPTIYVPVGILLFLNNKPVQGIAVIVFGFLVISQLDNFLRPYFIGKETKIHSMAIFFSLLGGVLVMGPVGLMAGPMLLTLILAITDVLRAKEQIEGQDENEPEPQPA